MIAFAVVFGLLAVFVAQSWLNSQAEMRMKSLEANKKPIATRTIVVAGKSLRFGSEFDCVYTAPARPLHLIQPSGRLEIAQSASCTETVVWNPGPALSAQLVDLPDDGWRHMLCVEAARIDEPVLLASGGSWQGWQQLTVV